MDMKIEKVKVERRVASEKPYEFLHYTVTAHLDEGERLDTTGHNLHLALDRLVGEVAKFTTAQIKLTVDDLKTKFGGEVAIHKDGERTYIQFPYNTPHFNQIKESVKRMGARWDAEAKLWVIEAPKQVELRKEA